MATAAMRVQLRSADAAALCETRARRSTRARPVAAAASGRANLSVNAVQFAEDKGSGLLVPVGKYCESHHKSIRRPTRYASTRGGRAGKPAG